VVAEGRDETEGARAEVLLYLQWARGAAGRHLPADGPAPRPSPPPPTPGATTEAACADVLAPVPPAQRGAALGRLVEAVAACRRCPLAATRTHTVPGEGSTTPRLVVVGEAPGAEEDRTGRPFVGAAGKLLGRMLAAIGLAREDVYIGNLLKCRPPGNRNPRPDEVAACKPFLREQLALLAPPLVLALGSPAARELLQTKRGITSLRGRFARSPEGYRVMPTYHPAYLLRNPAAKREAWLDLQKVAGDLGLEIPPRGR
jgi:uracil-DNA glycosylase family 4